MNASPPPTPPDDEAPDALLAALRQRLGSYGQAPPPAAWAAIRRRVAPLPPPWWRRPRRLLPLLALLGGLLLLSTPTGQVGWHWLAGQATSTSQKAAPFKTINPLATKPVARPLPEISHSPATIAAPATGPKFLPAEQLATLHRPGKVGEAISAPTQPAELLARAGAPAANGSATRPYPTGTAGRLPALLSSRAPAASYSPRGAASPAARQAASGKVAAARQATASVAATASARHHLIAARPATRLAPPATTYLVAAGRPAATRHPASVSITRSLAAHARMQPGRAKRRLASVTELPDSLVASAPAAASASPTRASTAVTGQLLPPSLPAAEQRTPLGLLALKQPSLLLPESALAPALAARPDSTSPSALARRWSVLVLAGPTLSYRTLGPAPTLAAGHPDFARLERPALGLGAQVQVRRVLSGRWALAVGVGYHEYATRLALTKDSAQSIHQRDTYRLLTVPVQLAYALGAPRGRLTTGLLLGAEPGWYLGGRSTEGSGCGCEQQVYSSAASSPYRSLSVAFSLGLDLRYRLGGASRWQWLVQPTGRYVATPFVRSDAVGFTRRQPLSLGLFTGFSWDVR